MSRSTGTGELESEFHFAECETGRIANLFATGGSPFRSIPSNDVTLGMWKRFREPAVARPAGCIKIKESNDAG